MQRKIRVLILEGSSKPPAFIRSLINGLNSHPGVHLGVFAKNESSKHLPGVRILPSDFGRFASLRILWGILRMCILAPKQMFQSVSLTDREATRKAWFKKLYRAALILNFNPSVIHFQWAAHIRQYRELIASKKYRCVVSLRGTQINVDPLFDPELVDIYKTFFPSVYVHAVSESMVQKALQFGASPDLCRVLYSPVPQAFFQAFERTLSISKRPLRVLSIGRFHWIKGYSYAIEAIHLLRQHGVDAHYTIVAPGAVPSDLLYQIRHRNLSEAVKILSGLSHSKIISTMKSHSVLLLSSVEEGIANVVLEAMAVGLPVVSTDCGGMGEVIHNGVTGWLVPIRNPGAMAKALISVQETSQADLMKMRLRAHETVSARFAYDGSIERFYAFYRWVDQERQ